MDNKNAKKNYHRIGLALFVMAVLLTGLQFLLLFLSRYWSMGGNSFWDSSWFFWLVAVVPLYGVSIPIGYLMLRKIPRNLGESRKLGVGKFLLYLIMCFPMMYGGNLIGMLVSKFLSGGMTTNSLTNLVLDDNPLKVIIMVILAPIMEELVFRKLVIDRTARYGEKSAILFSAIIFGLFHMNVNQVFYAFGVGLVFGFVYVRTRRIRYSIILHMVINFMGAVVAPFFVSLLSSLDLTKLFSGQLDEKYLLTVSPILIGISCYVFLLMGLFVAGLVLLIVKARRLEFHPAPEEILPEDCFKTIYCNVGVILFVLFCFGLIVLNLL